jgi:glycerol kinase
VAWLLDHVNGARRQAERGKLAFGTVDSFLIARLTGNRVHATDATNAARTSLYNIREPGWDDALLRIFNVPRAVLPEVRDCGADYGQTVPDLFGRPLPILGVAGDQQAASLGQCCFQPGTIKSTYGTGCFALINTGSEAVVSKNRLLTTIAYRLNGRTTFALEGSIFMAGAAVQWLRDGLGLIDRAGDTESLAGGLENNNGVYVVPAFTGLGAPYWNPDVRGAVFGIQQSTGPAEFARAVLESVCYQTHDLLRAMAEDSLPATSLRVDGGMVANNWLVQFLADILNLPVDRPRIQETTALGAATLAGMQAGLLGTPEEVARHWHLDKRFEPGMSPAKRRRLLAGWHDAVRRVTVAL